MLKLDNTIHFDIYIYIYISSWICKNIATRISLEAGHSQYGRLKPRGLNVKASTQTQPRYWPVGGWVARCCVQSTAGGEGSVWTLILYSECGLK